MGLGSTTKKIQMMADKAEQLYAQLNEVKQQLEDLRVKVDTTHETVTGLEVKHEQNRAILEALAEKEGIDVEQVITEASIEDAESQEAESADNESDELTENDTPDEPEEPTPTGSIDADEGGGTEPN
ncbi:MAG: DUF5798 family protein [Halalkalicoccus sp.]